MYNYSPFYPSKYVMARLPKWEFYPPGEEGHNVDPFNPQCPICEHKLLAVKKIGITSREKSPNGDCIDCELSTLICPHCQTKYIASIPMGLLKLSSGNENTDAINALTERVETLEALVKSLVQEVQQLRQERTHKPQTAKPEAEATDAEAQEFTNKYHYLL